MGVIRVVNTAPEPVPDRDRTLDVLRAIATLRVVVFHATGDVRWSWFAAMPVMFFVGGALYAQSLDRRPWQAVLRNRLRRIMIPTWVWASFVFAVFTVAGVWNDVPWWGALGFIVPITSPTGPPTVNGPFYWTWMHMWYISAYLLLMVLGISLRRAQRRWPLATFTALLAPVALSGLLREPRLGGLTFIVVFWVAGYAYHDHQDRLPSTRTAALIGLAAIAVALPYAAAFTGFTVDVKAIPFLFDLAGLAAVSLAIAARPWIRTWTNWRPVDIAVTWFQQRALTVYLWHAAAVGIVVNWLGRDTIPERADVLLVGLVLPITFVLVSAIGWVEDLAANRPLRWFPDVSVRHNPIADPTVSTVIDLRNPAPSVPDVEESQRRRTGT